MNSFTGKKELDLPSSSLTEIFGSANLEIETNPFSLY